MNNMNDLEQQKQAEHEVYDSYNPDEVTLAWTSGDKHINFGPCKESSDIVLKKKYRIYFDTQSDDFKWIVSKYKTENFVLDINNIKFNVLGLNEDKGYIEIVDSNNLLVGTSNKE